jgi:hypothetical protein
MRCGARCAPGGGKVWGGGGASGMHGEGDSRLLGVRARAERTSNMLRMLVTLEVSRLSGWLKAAADCQVEGRGTCDAGRGARREAGRWRHKRHAREKARDSRLLGVRARAERTWNM